MEKKSVETKKVPVDAKKKIYRVGGIIAALFLVAAAIMILENTGKYKLTVENNTSRNLEYVKLHFASMDTDFDSDEFFNEAIAADQTVVDKIPKLDLYGTMARLFVTFKFEGEEEKTIDNGWFNYSFSGKTYVTFEEKDDQITLDVSIKEGFLGNYNNECDEHWEIEFK